MNNIKLTVRFHTDPSGTFMKYEAKAIGSGSEAAQSELQDKYHSVRVKHVGLISRPNLILANDTC